MEQVARAAGSIPHHGLPGQLQGYDYDHRDGDQDKETKAEEDPAFLRDPAAGFIPGHWAEFVVGHETKAEGSVAGRG